jgi:hypothetical protein
LSSSFNIFIRLLKNAPACRQAGICCVPLSFVAAAYVKVRLNPQDLGHLASGAFLASLKKKIFPTGSL